MDDPVLPDTFTAADATTAGLTASQIARRVRTGRWRAPRRGVYVVAATFDAMDARRQHLTLVRAALLARGGDELASHLSAAAVLGWRCPLSGWGSPTVTSATLGVPVRRRRDLVVQVASVRDRDRRERAGVAVLSPARTAADLLRHLAPSESVPIVDGALRDENVGYEQVAEVLDWQAEWPYAARGLASSRLLDPRRETWLESRSFVDPGLRGVELPEPQVVVLDRRGRFVARCDGVWLDDAVAAEVDGQVKYDLTGPYLRGEHPDAAADELLRVAQQRLDAQRRRQDALADLGVRVVRWGLHDVLNDLAGLARRIEERRGAAGASEFRGTWQRPEPLPWR